jgi:hypothetical protein
VIQACLKRLGVSRKKTLKHPKANETLREEFKVKIEKYQSEGRAIVYADESGFAHESGRFKRLSSNHPNGFSKNKNSIVHCSRGASLVEVLGLEGLQSQLKAIYQSAEKQALLELERFAQTWDGKYPQISRSWLDNWHNLNTLFIYPDSNAHFIVR